MKKEKDILIEEISKMSDKYGDKLIKFMNDYNLYRLLDATEEQLQEFIEKEKNTNVSRM